MYLLITHYEWSIQVKRRVAFKWGVEYQQGYRGTSVVGDIRTICKWKYVLSCHWKLSEEAVSVQRCFFSSSHVKLGGSPRLRTSRKLVALDMPSYKCFCKVPCSVFSQGCKGSPQLSAEGSYSPSRPAWGGLRAQTLSLAPAPLCQTDLWLLICTGISVWVTGTWCVHTRAHLHT